MVEYFTVWHGMAEGSATRFSASESDIATLLSTSATLHLTSALEKRRVIIMF